MWLDEKRNYYREAETKISCPEMKKMGQKHFRLSQTIPCDAKACMTNVYSRVCKKVLLKVKNHIFRTVSLVFHLTFGNAEKR